MKVSKTRVGIVGIGFGQRILAPAFALQPNCEVIAICASTLKRAEVVAKRLGIQKAYGDWRCLLDDAQVDAIAIATPPKVQPEVAIAALGRSKPVFCEKPLATSTEAASAMVAAAKTAGVANMVDFEFPEIPTWRQAKAILDGGALGRIRHVSVNWNVETYAVRMGLNSWKTRPCDGGGTLFSFVSHTFHYLEWLIGPIAELSCCTFPSDARRTQETGDTFVTLSLRTDADIPVSVAVSTDAFLGNGHLLEVYGESGTLILRNKTSDYVNGFRLFHGTRESDRLQEILVGEEDTPAGSDGRLQAVGQMAGRFLNWIASAQSSQPNFEQGLRVHNLLDCALVSHREARRVSCGR
ncbi:MAG TPA: Gfo/Idh/MocA family oxidoreductase [Terriglobales bacterium]|nr:Gfo/Idh/MocA family oxidoreductase [Terriglobales bacterium]